MRYLFKGEKQKASFVMFYLKALDEVAKRLPVAPLAGVAASPGVGFFFFRYKQLELVLRTSGDFLVILGLTNVRYVAFGEYPRVLEGLDKDGVEGMQLGNLHRPDLRPCLCWQLSEPQESKWRKQLGRWVSSIFE